MPAVVLTLENLLIQVQQVQASVTEISFCFSCQTFDPCSAVREQKILDVRSSLKISEANAARQSAHNVVEAIMMSEQRLRVATGSLVTIVVSVAGISCGDAN